MALKSMQNSPPVVHWPHHIEGFLLMWRKSLMPVRVVSLKILLTFFLIQRGTCSPTLGGLTQWESTCSQDESAVRFRYPPLLVLKSYNYD